MLLWQTGQVNQTVAIAIGGRWIADEEGEESVAAAAEEQEDQAQHYDIRQGCGLEAKHGL